MDGEEDAKTAIAALDGQRFAGSNMHVEVNIHYAFIHIKLYLPEVPINVYALLLILSSRSLIFFDNNLENEHDFAKYLR